MLVCMGISQDLLWVLVAKRFLWQANGEDGKRADGKPRVGERVTVEWGDALNVLPRLAQSGVRADLLLLDGVPSEYLAYLKAAELLLAPGAHVVADNVGCVLRCVCSHKAQLMEPRQNRHVRSGSRPWCEKLTFQRERARCQGHASRLVDPACVGYAGLTSGPAALWWWSYTGRNEIANCMMAGLA